MCNAWNHPPGCTCGWGGEGHLGRRTGGSHTSFNVWPYGIPPIRAVTYHSYTIPNATCPVCGAEVFYYCNEYGSSVFFDDLGPPWPKHPCTDNSKKYTPAILTRNTSTTHILRNKWEVDGWTLCEFLSIYEIDRNTFKLTIKPITSEDSITCYFSADKILISEPIADAVRASPAIFSRKESNNDYSLAFLSKTLKSVRTKAYPSVIDLRSNFKTHSRRSKNNRSHIPSKRRKAANNKKKMKNPVNTSMADAFEKADFKKPTS